MSELAREIASRRCPHCKTQGSMQLQMAHACVVCRVCLRSFIDPFAEGPWDMDKDKIILDTIKGNVVSSYSAVIEDVSEEEVEKSRAWSEFDRYLREKEKKESLEGG